MSIVSDYQKYEKLIKRIKLLEWDEVEKKTQNRSTSTFFTSKQQNNTFYTNIEQARVYKYVKQYL